MKSYGAMDDVEAAEVVQMELVDRGEGIDGADDGSKGGDIIGRCDGELYAGDVECGDRTVGGREDVAISDAERTITSELDPGGDCKSERTDGPRRRIQRLGLRGAPRRRFINSVDPTRIAEVCSVDAGRYRIESRLCLGESGIGKLRRDLGSNDFRWPTQKDVAGLGIGSCPVRFIS